MADKYWMDEDQINKVIDVIPGDSIVHKIWGALSVLVYVFARSGADPQTAGKLVALTMQATVKVIPTFEDMTEKDKVELNRCLEETGVKVGQALDQDAGKTKPYSFKPTEADFSED